LSGIVGLIVALVMAVWIYLVVKKHDGQLPWLWATGAFVFWPLVITVAGFEYNETVMKVVGIISMCLIVLGIVMTIGLVSIL
jgi:hypothetical protein